MRALLSVVATLALMLIAGGSSADLVDIPRLLYEADALPEDSDPAWGRVTSFTPVAEITPTGEFHFVTEGYAGNTSNDWWYLYDPIPPGHHAVFVEIRVRVESTNWQDGLITFIYADAYSRININTEAVGYMAALGPSFNHFMDTTDQFHVYRLEFFPGSGTYKFYTDGVLRDTSTGTDHTYLSEQIRIGNWGPDWQADIYIDYIHAGFMADPVASQDSSWGAIKSWFQQ